MKTIIAATALTALLIASPASAQISDESARRTCATYGLIAQNIMKWRLSDVPLSDALERNDMAAVIPEQRHYFRLMTMEA